MTSETLFETEQLAAAFDTAVANCTELTRAEAAHFVEHGHVVIEAAIPKEMANVACQSAWAELEANYRIERNDPATWDGVSTGRGGMRGDVRTQGTEARSLLKTRAPRAFAAQADVVGGANRLPDGGKTLSWGDAVIGNFRVPDGPPWQPPAARQPGWHKDGHHFRHFINSPEQGLLTVPIYTDILPQSGGTFIACDSIAPVARLLAQCPAGVHPDGTQAGYLIPGLIEQCSAFAELTGEAGDVVLVHPFMLHRVSVNPSNRPRFIANMAVVLTQPMCFDRPPGDAYSLVELAVLRALEVPRFEFKPTRAPLSVQPFPFRDEEEAAKQRVLVEREMEEMAVRGISTPAWGRDFGYLSKTEPMH